MKPFFGSRAQRRTRPNQDERDGLKAVTFSGGGTVRLPLALVRYIESESNRDPAPTPQMESATDVHDAPVVDDAPTAETPALDVVP